MDLKVCPKCHQEKSLEEFSPSRSRKSGRSSWCKGCVALAVAQRRSNTYIYSDKTVTSRENKANGIKSCTCCKEQKPTEEFYKDRSRSDGYDTKCKSCRDAYNKEYELLHLEEIYEYRNKYYAENREDNILRLKDHYRTNRDEKLQRNKDYNKSHREEIKIYRSIYYRTPNGRSVIIRGRHRRRNREVENTLTYEQWILCLQEVGNCCPMCDRSFDTIQPTRDHIIPVIKGGGLTYWNVQPLCNRCNASKGTSDRIDHQLRKAQTIANRLKAAIDR